MTPKDERLARSIEIAELEAYSARTSEEARIAHERVRTLKNQRSPEARRLESESDND